MITKKKRLRQRKDATETSTEAPGAEAGGYYTTAEMSKLNRYFQSKVGKNWGFDVRESRLLVRRIAPPGTPFSNALRYYGSDSAPRAAASKPPYLVRRIQSSIHRV